jgi:hypothetical protein
MGFSQYRYLQPNPRIPFAPHVQTGDIGDVFIDVIDGPQSRGLEEICMYARSPDLVLIPPPRVTNQIFPTTAERVYTWMENHICRHQGMGRRGLLVCRGHSVIPQILELRLQEKVMLRLWRCGSLGLRGADP